jgi:hypothetical protein
MLAAGRLSSLVDGIKADTVADFLDQADDLVASKHEVAAAVIAGGALETFLHHLCAMHGRQWQPPGSIEKYRAVLAAATSNGDVVLDETDGKLVTSWGGIRNDAAHTPTAFKRTPEEVTAMILGITQFVKRMS